MDKVSKEIDGGIQSLYFDIPRPNIPINNKIFIYCESLLTYLALADFDRGKETFKKLESHFMKTISLCVCSNDLKYVNEILKRAASIGGYAQEFYYLYASKIKERIVEIEQENLNPVFIMTSEGIESKYYNVTYKPKNFDLLMASLAFPIYLSYADLKRDKDNIKSLELRFYKALQDCKSKEDYQELSTLMSMFASYGGYAKYFYNNIKDMINEEGKKETLKILQKEEAMDFKTKDKLENFIKEYNRLEELFEKLRNTDLLFIEDVNYLIEKYNVLLAILYMFGQKIDETYANEYEDQIKETINYLNNLASSLDGKSKLSKFPN